MPITVGTLGRLRAVDQRGRDIVFSFESSDLVLTPLLPNVVRHTWVPTHWRLYTGRVTDSYAVPRRDWPAGPAVRPRWRLTTWSASASRHGRSTMPSASAATKLRRGV